MKLTPELKERYFAAHWGQKVLKYSDNAGLEHKIISGYRIVGLQDYDFNDTSYLELFDLADITDDDAIEAAKLSNAELYLRSFKKCFTGKEDLHLYSLSVGSIDFLRSRSYALPFMGIPVSELIKAGWLKIRKTPHQ